VVPLMLSGPDETAGEVRHILGLAQRAAASIASQLPAPAHMQTPELGSQRNAGGVADLFRFDGTCPVIPRSCMSDAGGGACSAMVALSAGSICPLASYGEMQAIATRTIRVAGDTVHGLKKLVMRHLCLNRGIDFWSPQV
jgi:hypothetical protein